MVGVLDGDGVYRFLAVATLDVPTGVVFLGLVPGDADSACVQGVAPPIGLVLSEAGGSIEQPVACLTGKVCFSKSVRACTLYFFGYHSQTFIVYTNTPNQTPKTKKSFQNVTVFTLLINRSLRGAPLLPLNT